MSYRVVITGMGVVSSLGEDVTSFGQAVQRGQSGIVPLEFTPTERLQLKVAGAINDFNGTKHFSNKELSGLDRYSQFALVAARQAVKASGVDFGKDGLGRKTATIIASGSGGMTTIDDAAARLYRDQANRVQPLGVPRMMISAAASHVAIEFALNGLAYTVSSACSSSNHAIGHALQLVRSGSARAAITGGTEASLTFVSLKGWESLRIVSNDGCCRPFALGRSGFVLGEGAAVFVLERLEDARARGADILAELAGVGMTTDGDHLTMPKRETGAEAVSLALEDARLNPEDVDYINAHGTATVASDLAETQVVHDVFGDHCRKLPISSTKSMTGHPLGAAGALELAATVSAMRGGFIPPTINYDAPDPKCDLDYVPNEGRQAVIRAALSNSFAFGGLNAVLAIRSVN